MKPTMMWLALVTAALAGLASAEIPQMLSYQGKVTDTSGNPVADGSYTMRFRIYDAVSAGTLEWDSGDRTIAVSGGVFSVLLGESPQPALDMEFDEDLWLAVRFNGVDQTPRVRLTAVGYAYMASGLVPGTAILGPVASSTSGAVKAVNTSGTGTRYGGYFESQSTSGKGVYGEAPHTGIYGKATATTGVNYGGSFVSNSTDGQGVHGEAPHIGVYGRATATSGEHYGGSFLSSSFEGIGLYAEAPDYGLIAVSTANVGTVGKKGIVTEGWMRGIDALARSPDSGWGVRGEGGAAGGHFVDTNSSSTASIACSYHKIAGTGDVSFVQNHPHEHNRVIVYVAPEGDEVATYTRGTARLVDGVVTVTLGETFELVTNPDIGLTAHLTPRGDCRGLYVESLSTRDMTVRELGGGVSDATFDYLVYGLRIGFEEVGIIQNKTYEAYIPSMRDVHVLYETYPELRKHNALERFTRMSAAAGIGGKVDLTAARTLRDAIQEYDPSVHGSIAPAPVARPYSREEQGGISQRGLGTRGLAQNGLLER